MSIDSNLEQGFTSSFRDYFDNFLWARKTTREVTLEEIGFKLTPKGLIDMRNGVDDLDFPLGEMVKCTLPSGMRCVLLMTRLGVVGLYEFMPDAKQPKYLGLNILQSTRIAKYRFIRRLAGNDEILGQLLSTFGYPEQGIQNLHEQLEALRGDLA